jgi:hypothetical protein
LKIKIDQAKEIKIQLKYNTHAIRMSSKVNYKNFNPDFLSIKEPELRKTKPNPNKPTAPDYYVLPYLYNYGTKDKPQYGDFHLEGPDFITTGVHEKPSMADPNIMDYTILIHFKPEVPEHMEFLKVFDSIYYKSASLIEGVKYKIGQPDFDEKSPKSAFKYPIYIPINKNGPIPGKNKSFFLKLYERGPYKTLFTLPSKTNKVNIDKNDLKNVTLKIKPLLSFQWIHIGQKMTIQTELKSAVVGDLDERNIETTQTDTIDEMLEGDPELEDKMASKYAKLLMNKKNVLPLTKDPVKTPPSHNSQEDPNDQQVLGGIHPTDADAEPPKPSNLPPQLSDAVKSAPKRKQFKVPFTSEN